MGDQGLCPFCQLVRLSTVFSFTVLTPLSPSICLHDCLCLFTLYARLVSVTFFHLEKNNSWLPDRETKGFVAKGVRPPVPLGVEFPPSRQTWQSNPKDNREFTIYQLTIYQADILNPPDEPPAPPPPLLLLLLW